LTIKEN